MKVDGTPSRREMELALMRRAGYDNDQKARVRLLVEARSAGRQALNDAWARGQLIAEHLAPKESFCATCGEPGGASGTSMWTHVHRHGPTDHDYEHAPHKKEGCDV